MKSLIKAYLFYYFVKYITYGVYKHMSDFMTVGVPVSFKNGTVQIKNIPELEKISFFGIFRIFYYQIAMLYSRD